MHKLLLAIVVALAGFVASLIWGTRGSGEVPTELDELSFVTRTPEPFEERLQRAYFRLKTGSAAATELRGITRDPIAAARMAISERDFRFINIETRTLLYHAWLRPTYTNIYCAVPEEFQPLLMRSHLVLYVSDVIGEPDGGGAATLSPLDREAAAVYNSTFLASPRFPHADICVEFRSLRPASAFAPAPASSAPLPWTRLSTRPARAVDKEDRPSIAIRNHAAVTKLTRADLSSGDRPDFLGLTPLAWAAARGSTGDVATLLQASADPWFGNYCSLRGRDSSNIAPMAGNEHSSPLWIAINAARADVVELMLTTAPTKPCVGDTLRRRSALDEKFTVLSSFIRHAGERGLPQAQRKLLRGHFAEMSRSPFDKALFEDFARLAFQTGYGAMFEPVSERYLAQDRDTFLGIVASYASSSELRRWRERLGGNDYAAIRQMIQSIYVGDAGDADAKRDFLQKLTALVDATRSFTLEQRAKLLGDTVATGTMMARVREDRPTTEAIVETFTKAGYELNGRYGADGCTLLLRAIAYSGECDSSLTHPLLAEALIARGVDVNVLSGRRHSALDLAKARANNGPYERAYARLDDKLRDVGAKTAAELTRPPPEQPSRLPAGLQERLDETMKTIGDIPGQQPS